MKYGLWSAMLLHAGTFLLAGAVAQADDGRDGQQWRPLFNEKDLSGWYTFITGQGRDKDPDGLIQVHDGMVHAYKDAKDGSDQPIGYFCTNAEYSHYRLRFQYKWGKKRFAPRAETLRDAGLLYHVTGPDGRWGGVWPLSVECQVQETDTGDLITVDTRCTTHIDPKTEGKEDQYPVYMPAEKGGKKITNTWYVSADKKCDKLEGWNDVEVEVRGSERAVHVVNGEVNHRLADIEQPTEDGWKPLEKGRIAFQIESAEVMYRNIELLPLSEGEGPAPAEGRKSRGTPSAGMEETSGLDHLTVPEAFEVELAAGPPLVHYPMMGCLDDRGRLFIAESDGVNRESVGKILEDRPHKILMLEDTDNDGRFDKSTVFAEGLVQANGAEWHDGALYVCSAPYVWRFRDTDGDGKADEQLRVVGTFNFDGMSSAFHGPVFGPDGRMYWSGGQHGWRLEPMLKASDADAPAGAAGPDAQLTGPWTRTSPGAFSSWPDGSNPQNIGYGGIANPVETTFTEAGEVIGTIALLDYVENQRRDAIVHWIDGGIYYMKDFNYAGLVRTGDDLLPLHFPGHVAPSGIMRYRSDQFGEEYRDTYFFAEFNSHKVSRLVVAREGAAFRGQDEDFLTSSNEDMHFTDVMEDADGSLLVLDTGGWFLHGCPASQFAKPDIHGAVYRIRRKSARMVDDPRGLKLNWENAAVEKLIVRFEDSRFAVRDRAVHEVVQRGDAAVGQLAIAVAEGLPKTRLLSVWALNRIASSGALAAIRTALTDDDLSVCLAAIHCLGLHRDEAALPQLVESLGREEAAVRREAATVVGQLRATGAVKPLLAAAGDGGDRFLEHAITLALVRIGNEAGTAQGLTSDSATARCLSIVALDQMGSPFLKREAVVHALDSPDAALHRAALDVLQRRPEWSDEIAGRLKLWLEGDVVTKDKYAAIPGIIRASWQEASVQSVVAHSLMNDNHDDDLKLMLLEAIGSVDGDSLPPEWIPALEHCLRSQNPEVVAQAIDTVNKHDVTACDAAIRQIVIDVTHPEPVRIAGAARLVRDAEPLSDALFAALLDLLGRNIDSVDRLSAAQAITGARLSIRQLNQLAAFLPQAGSLELPILLRAFEQSSAPDLGNRLVESLLKMEEIGDLPQQQLERLLQRYPSTVGERATRLLAHSKLAGTIDAERLQALADAVADGDPDAGRAVFFGTRAACSKCHRVGGEGGQVGPNLSEIGAIRSSLDLVEAVLYPSASFVRDFESYIILTTQGKVIDGLVSRQTSRAVYMRLADLTEVRVDRDDIDEMRPSDVSIMPQGLEKTLSELELRDLVSYLQSLKK